MRVLFLMRSTVYVRNFESTLRLLSARGHQVHVAADPHHQLDQTDLIGRLCSQHPGITHAPPPQPVATTWSQFGYELRRGLDYLRYLEPEYRDAPKLRRRAEQKVPVFIASRPGRALSATAAGRRILRGVVRNADRAVPADPVIDAFVRAHRPDLLLVTPLVEPGSPQSEYIRSAQALGVRTGLCVYSWDNLTNKGLIHDELDVVTVWNEPMKDEAVRLHGVDPDRVVVTGAAPYDHWFGWQPRLTREGFCARVGLDGRRPYLLYLCSSKFIAPDELPFVRRWIETVRASSETLRDAGVLVRPHPQNAAAWRDAELSDLGNAAVWPRAHGNPVDEESRSEYFDSIYHSAAVVGVNTSAQIESAIVGRGVFTLLAPEFRETQEGTLHFRHLRDVNGGLLHVATDFAEHTRQLERALRDPQAAAERCRRFIEAFVRPYGVDQPATPRLVDALETAAARPRVRREPRPWWAGMAQPGLHRVALALDRAERQRDPGKKPSKDKRKPKEPARRPEPPQAEATRIAADAYQHYLAVREAVCAMQRMQPPPELSERERQMIAALAPLRDADQETIADLRSYSKAISGVRRGNYRAPRAEIVKVRLERDLQRLLDKGDGALWVAEPSTLGGFGVESMGKLYNEDTLRFFKVLSLLQDAAVLRDFRSHASHRTVWEIGGGWGGFAYQFKRLCPGVTYLITGLPDLFLVSGVYLRTMFPTARFRFYDPARPEEFWRDWHEVDFAFAPESVVAGLRPPSLDLVLDLRALERMIPSRSALHVERAYELRAPYVFSICSSGTDGGETGAAVRRAVERFYWPHPMSAAAYLDRRLAVREGTTYLLGWRRLRI